MGNAFLFYFLSSVINALINIFVLVPVTTYYLDPADFGVFGILQTLTMPIGPIGTMGIINVISGNYFKYEGEARATLLFNVLLTETAVKYTILAIYWIFSYQLLHVLIKDYQPQFHSYFLLLLLSLALGVWWTSVTQIMVLKGHARSYFVFDLSRYVVHTVATIVALNLFHARTEALFIGPLAASVFLALSCLWYLRQHTIAKIEFKWVKEVVSVGSAMMPANIIDVLRDSVDRYFLQIWAGLAEVGMYSHTLIYNRFFLMFSKAFIRIGAPLALATFTKGEEPKRLILAQRCMCYVLTASGIVLALFSREIVTLLTHGKFTSVHYLLPVWFMIVHPMIYNLPGVQYLYINNENFFMARMRVLIGLTSIPCIIAGVYYFGMIGAAVAVLASKSLLQMVYGWKAERIGMRADTAGKDFVLSYIQILIVMLICNLIQLPILIKFLLAAILILVNTLYSKDIFNRNNLRMLQETRLSNL